MAGPPPTLGSMLTGTVKSWKEERGMGFIQADTGGDDLFVHRSDLADGNCLTVGAPVMFEDGWDAAKGKRVAKQLTGAQMAEGKGAAVGVGMMAGKGPSAPPSGIPPATLGQMITGVVKSWMEEKGMGFVAPDTGGDDAFVHRSYLVDGQWLVPGSPVAFEDGWDVKKNKRIAQKVTGCAGGVVAPGIGLGNPQAAAALAGMNALVAGEPQPPPPAGMPMSMMGMEGLVGGTVKAWVEAKGMGFIAPDTGGDDIFVHRSSLVDSQWLVVGARVMYEEGWDERKGKAQTKRVVTSGGGGLPGQPPPPLGAPPAALMMAGANMQTGVVKSWIEERGMGFIAPHSGGEDIFVHRSDILDSQFLVVGAQVTFEEAIDERKGKRIARKCSSGGAMQAMGGKGGGAAMGLQSGTVKMWFTEKAFGFIVPDAGGDDVMVHKNEVADNLMMAQGVRVLFAANWDPAKGKLKATRCVSESNPNGGYGGYGGGGGGYGGGGYGGGKPAASGVQDNLFVAGLPLDMTQEMLQMIFGQYGTVASCKVLPANGKPDIAALVRMADPEMAAWIVNNLNGNIPQGMTTPVRVQFKAASTNPGGGYGKATGVVMDPRFSPYGAGTSAAGAMAAATMPAATPAVDTAGGEAAALAALLAQAGAVHTALHSAPGVSL